MKKIIFSFLLAGLFLSVSEITAQDAGTYKKPPKAMEDILMAKPTPGVSIDDKGEWMLFSQYNPYPTVEELARPELRIAGIRINPNNFAPSRQTFINTVYLKNISSDKELPVTGLPVPLYAGNISWSPDDKKIALTHTTASRVDLYVITVATQKAVKVNKMALNTVVGDITWFDNNTLYYNAAPQSAAAAPPKPLAPTGPAIQENYGKASPRPTFQDMIKGPYDESLFAFYATTQLIKNVNGVETKIGQPVIYNYYSFSPIKNTCCRPLFRNHILTWCATAVFLLL